MAEKDGILRPVSIPLHVHDYRKDNKVMNDTRNEFAAPLGSATVGRLEFGRGTYNLAMHADASTADLYHARFEGTAPDVRAEDGTVRIDYPRSWRPLDWGEHTAEVALNAAVPWGINVRGGAARINADLSGLRLEFFEIDGGVHNVEMTLPEPSGTVSIRVEGGASSLRVRRPRDVATRLHVGRGASKLAFDDQRLGAVGGETTLESGNYTRATDRYEITITGGANDVSVLTT